MTLLFQFVEFANSIQEIGAQQHELDRFVGNLYAMVMLDHDDASTLKQYVYGVEGEGRLRARRVAWDRGVAWEFDG